FHLPGALGVEFQPGFDRIELALGPQREPDLVAKRRLARLDDIQLAHVPSSALRLGSAGSPIIGLLAAASCERCPAGRLLQRAWSGLPWRRTWWRAAGNRRSPPVRRPR